MIRPTKDVDADIHAERRRRAAFRMRLGESESLRRAALIRCRRDPLFWLGNFAYIKANPAMVRKYGTLAIPVLLWDYTIEGVCRFLGWYPPDEWRVEWPYSSVGLPEYYSPLRSTVVVASREMGKTKLPALAALWDWQFHIGATYGFLSRVERDVDDNKSTGDGSIFSFIRWAIRRQPQWLRPVAWRGARHRFDDCWLGLINAERGNSLIGGSTTEDALKGLRCKRVVIDEANFVPGLESMIESLRAVGPLWVSSSVRGRATDFARLQHGELVMVSDPPQEYGWGKLTWHFSLRPDRDPSTEAGTKWVGRTRAEMTQQAWAQEYELDDMASTPGRIWGDLITPAHDVGDAEWREEILPLLTNRKLTIAEGWDFGFSAAATAVVWIAYHAGVFFILDYRHWLDAILGTVVDGIGDAGFHTRRNPRGILPAIRVGDRASGFGHRLIGGRRQTQSKTWIQTLREYDVYIRGQSLEIETSIHIVADAFRRGVLRMCPPCHVRHGGLPNLRECVLQYARHMSTGNLEYVGDTPPPRKDIYSHIADGIQHAMHALT